MKMLRRTRPDDSATEFPTPQQIASSGQDESSGDWEQQKDSQQASEIDAVIGCLVSILACFSLKGRGKSSKMGCLNVYTGALLVIGIIGLFSFRSFHKDSGTEAGGWGPMRVGFNSLGAVTTLGAKRKLALGPPKKPVKAVISTHHRTGTVLFQSMGERLCEVFLMDYERVDEAFKLGNPNDTRTLLYQRYWNTTGRLVAGMHGFAEDCEQGQDVGMYCDPLDYKCWLDACDAIDQNPEEPIIPITHVVRNPVEILISAYLYHQQDPPPEEWLYYPKPDALEILPMELQEKFAEVPYYKVLMQLPPELGILVEFTVENSEIYRMARNYRDMAKMGYAKNLHFEDFKTDFKGSVRTTLDHLGITATYGTKEVMSIAMIFDLNNMPEIERNAYQVENHITEGKHNKQDLRELLHNNATTRHMLDALAQVMDYETAFPSIEEKSQIVHNLLEQPVSAETQSSKRAPASKERTSRKLLD